MLTTRDYESCSPGQETQLVMFGDLGRVAFNPHPHKYQTFLNDLNPLSSSIEDTIFIFIFLIFRIKKLIRNIKY